MSKTKQQQIEERIKKEFPPRKIVIRTDVKKVIRVLETLQPKENGAKTAN